MLKAELLAARRIPLACRTRVLIMRTHMDVERRRDLLEQLVLVGLRDTARRRAADLLLVGRNQTERVAVVAGGGSRVLVKHMVKVGIGDQMRTRKIVVGILQRRRDRHIRQPKISRLLQLLVVYVWYCVQL